ncbi:MAG: hypothetical protein AB7U75_15635 [Hyphomicrobiaceae bacterium]
MTRIFEAKTRTGQTLVYCVAEGRRGEQALRELERQCQGGSITKVSGDDVLRAETRRFVDQRKPRSGR